MERVIIEPLEKRIDAIELRIGFMESWKNTPYIQITIPLIISLFMATSWVTVAMAQMDKRIDLLEKRMDKLEVRMDRLESKMDKLESKMDLVLIELRNIRKT